LAPKVRGFFSGGNMLVSELFSHAGSDAKGKYISPTVGSNEWNQWLSWSNEELMSFGEVHDWPEMTNKHFPIQISGTSGALPSNFKKIAGYPILDGVAQKEVDSDKFDLYDSDEDVFRTGFNSGWFIEFKQSGTSVLIPLISYPTSLATPTDSFNMRNPMYLVKRLKVRIFKYRQDPIFTELESEANLMLQQMLENEYYKHSQYEGGATTREEDAGFVLGES
jgi:hypothetical protein